jgi:hypothetical protein
MRDYRCCFLNVNDRIDEVMELDCVCDDEAEIAANRLLAGYTSTAIVDGKPQDMDPREGQAGGAASGRQQSRS